MHSDSSEEPKRPWHDDFNPFADFEPRSYPDVDPQFSREDFRQNNPSSSNARPSRPSSPSPSTSASPPPPPPPPHQGPPQPRRVNAPFNLKKLSADTIVSRLKNCVSFEHLMRTVLVRLPHVNASNRKAWGDLDHSSNLKVWRQVVLVRP